MDNDAEHFQQLINRPGGSIKVIVAIDLQPALLQHPVVHHVQQLTDAVGNRTGGLFQRLLQVFIFDGMDLFDEFIGSALHRKPQKI